MTRNRKTYRVPQLVSAIFMIMALLWLTISAPFVIASQKELAKQNKMASASNPLPGNEEESTNPLGNNTEEKTPGNGSSISEEYLHDHHITDHFFSISLQYDKCGNAGTYTAFHGELIVPPPNAA